MPLFRKAAPQDPLIVAMSGARMGLRVLILVADDAEMPVDVAAKVGLSGQTIAVGETPDALARVAGRGERRGVLVETAVLELPLQYGDGTFDLAIADDRSQPAGTRTDEGLLREVFRVLRPGGRLVVLRAAPKSAAFFSRAPGPDVDAGVRALAEKLVTAGFRAVREIATREKTMFFEAVRSV
jgi:ubiquinone/menaquinone biosynthesis C-methylase UbiE